MGGSKEADPVGCVIHKYYSEKRLAKTKEALKVLSVQYKCTAQGIAGYVCHWRLVYVCMYSYLLKNTEQENVMVVFLTFTIAIKII